MCGRASLLVVNPDEIADQLHAQLADGVRDQYKQRWNLGPMQTTLVMRLNHGERLVEPAKWGVERVVGKKPDGTFKKATPFNTMSEKVLSGSWRKAFEERRCVIPFSGFYEWVGPKNDRRPIHFTRADGKLLLLAGVFDSPKDDEPLRFSVLTTRANEFMARTHDRMPVILDPANLKHWLTSPASGLLVPAPEDLLVGNPASKRVNVVGKDHEGPECLVPEPPPLI